MCKRLKGFLLGGVIGFMLMGRAEAQDRTRSAVRHHVYIILWFDTEDYILPQSDDAAKRIANMLTDMGVKATFKVVGEKARTLERRGRTDVIAALQKHEIGYHSNTHSQHPTPAEYEEPLGWDEGLREFTRRERGGFDDVARLFGQKPTCYGQPGSSWAPQSFGALREWGVNVYLDEAGQVGLDGKPFWYGGLLNIFNTREGGRIRANQTWSNMEDAKDAFAGFQRSMSATGGIVSIFFHPCEFVHAEFWDGVNFARGANPPRAEWKLPRMKTEAEQERAFAYLKEMVRFLKAYPNVRFITASEALKLYADRAQGRDFGTAEIGQIAKAAGTDIGFQVRADLALSPADIFSLLTRYSAAVIRAGNSSSIKSVRLEGTPFGPRSTTAESIPAAGLEIRWEQFARSIIDVDAYIRSEGQIPTRVWLGSVHVSPESYLSALAAVIPTLQRGVKRPESVIILPARISTVKYVAEDKPSLWNWVIFPPGFHAPNLMAQARLQAWTLKPAILNESANDTNR